MKHFDFDEWRHRYMRWMNDNKSRVMDFFRKQHRDHDGKITRQEFIDGILQSSQFLNCLSLCFCLSLSFVLFFTLLELPQLSELHCDILPTSPENFGFLLFLSIYLLNHLHRHKHF